MASGLRSLIVMEPAAVSFSSFAPKHRRRILLVFPQYSHSFGTFEHAFPLVGSVRAFMPPQGILLIASLLPRSWEVKFVDENIRAVTPEELDWADAVFISGMHIQRARIQDLNRRAQRAGRLTVLGGPSVSAAPEHYPDVDVLHCGEVGDGTLRLFEYLDERTARPATQRVFRTAERLGMTDFPTPAYHLIDVRQYLLGSVQFSSGCPFLCEFCDIPALYGRRPRMKSPEQVVREMDLLSAGGTDSIYFVDDNFIADPRATARLLPHLVEWQARHDYRIVLSCEATLNITRHPEVLALMRDAGFGTVFCGIETPEPAALEAMNKRQNLRAPILQAIDTLNRYGMEVASGIILGLDTDTPATPQAIIDFAEASQVPILTVNLLYALPHTPLYARLERAGRIVPDEGRDSNIDFLEPYEVVLGRWRHVVSRLYEPARLLARYATQARRTYPNRRRPSHPWRQLTWRNLKRAGGILGRTVWRLGVRGDYRAEFWKMLWTQTRNGDVAATFRVAFVSYHLITYARECLRGMVPSSNYSGRDVIAEDRAGLASLSGAGLE